MTPIQERTGHAFDEDARIAACALMLAISRADDEFTDEERNQIFSALKKEYGLSDEHAKSLIERAERRFEDSLDLWHFTRELNDKLSKDQKIRILKQLWKIVFTDSRIHGHEDYLIHKIADMLQLEHADLIDTKIHVIDEKRASGKKS